jgi:iron complex transport system ATP-binding protein
LTELLECRGLSAGYGPVRVLHDIGLSIRSGESVALLGPNGSGKSTLLRACCKTQSISEGSINLGGDSIATLSHLQVARRVAFVPQEEIAPFPFRVRDVVTMGRISLSESYFDSREDQLAADEAMAFTACIDLQDRPVTELSGGERQRVLIARALAQQTPLILLDEPTSHLDIAHQLGVANLIRSLSRRGIGSLTAIHDLNLAPLIADRAVLLAGGRVVADGPMEEILRSELLDQTYGVRFERAELAEGRVFLLASSG